jgi:hypothetical protein
MMLDGISTAYKLIAKSASEIVEELISFANTIWGKSFRQGYLLEEG